MSFKISETAKEKPDYFKEHRSISVNLSQDEYAFMMEMASSVEGMSKLLRKMLEYQIQNRTQAPRKVNFWVTALFYVSLRNKATSLGMSVTNFINASIRDCIQDLRKEEKEKAS